MAKPISTYTGRNKENKFASLCIADNQCKIYGIDDIHIQIFILVNSKKESGQKKFKETMYVSMFMNDECNNCDYHI